MPETAPQTPLIPVATVASGRTHTLWFLAAFYSLAVVWGIRNMLQDEPSGLDQLVPIAFAICLGWWAVVDARRRRQSIPMLARPWFFLLAGLLVPMYVLRSRGWRGAGWMALHGVLWYALATIVLIVGGVSVAILRAR